MIRVLLLGASGVFGSRLAELLAAELGITLILAGRTRSALQALAARLPAPSEIAIVERNLLSAAALAELRCHVLIDAAGPFDARHTLVIEAALDVGIHYFDLAENRYFIRAITKYDAAARAKGVAILAGVSSIPALSHAVIDALTANWQRYDQISVGIFPGNRAPRGLSVVQAILSYVGKPVHVFREGAWQDVPGWGLTHRADISSVGARWASVCETAEQDLLVARYRPTVSAEFYAGLELSVLHLGLALLSLPVRWGWLASLLPRARVLLRIAQLLRPLGSDRGGMLVTIAGRNGMGEPQLIRWSLYADTNRGPYVPTLAALLMVKQLRDGALSFRGAAPCAGLLPLERFQQELARLHITTKTDTQSYSPAIFATALGQAFAKLPAVTQRLHRPAPAAVWHGEADVTGPTTLLGRIVARLFSFPASAQRAPIRVCLTADPDGTEHWSRIYPDRIMRSTMSDPDPASSSIVERFGLVAVRLRLSATAEGLTMQPISWRAWKIPLPRFLLPRINATERAAGDQHLFDVKIQLPVIGHLVHYRGRLQQYEAQR